MNDKKEITVTSPLLPELNDLQPMLKEIWESKWVTNGGRFLRQFEHELAQYLEVPYVSVFTNGSLPLITALQSLRLTGEIITTPFTAAATIHAIWWNNLTPVFVDIDPLTCNIDPEKIEEAITPETSAILAVHCYGNPCNIDKIQEIANRHNLRVIYDAAHAFGVKIHNKSIVEYGDLSTISFHATKVYNTLEGGALIMHDESSKRQIDDYLKWFGFNDGDFIAPGINSKMDEVRAALGLLNLRIIDDAISKRKQIAQQYRENLCEVDGITLLHELPGVKYNYSYFPIIINEQKYGITRNNIYDKLKSHNIICRKYFNPLISELPAYRNLKSSTKDNLPIATHISQNVMCIPIYPDLTQQDVNNIISLIKSHC